MAGGPSLFHPLCGSNLATLLRLLTRNGPVALNRLPQVSIALLATLLRWPLTTTERVLSGPLLRRREPMPAPVFIVGYWRSGTTHLHNVLGRDPQFAYITPLATGLPWDLFGIVTPLRRLLEHALPEDRYVDKVAVRPDSPQEDSIALANMIAVSYYHGMYFPQRFEHHFRRGVYFENCSSKEIEQWRRTLVLLLEKVSALQGGRPVLLKNPVYTGHIDRIRAIWPEARFIHIYRNPFVVFRSTRHFFTRLMPELALQDTHGAPVDEMILESYPRLMNALHEQSARLPGNRFVELRFEDFETAPLEQLERIYTTLDLPGFAAARQNFQAYLGSLAGYRKNRYDFEPAMVRTVQQHWGSFIERWGYEAP